MNKKHIFLSGVLGLIFCFLNAQETDESILTVDRIFNNYEFGSRAYFGPARWTEDGDLYTTVERSAQTRGGMDIVRYDTKTGDRSVYVEAKNLIPANSTSPLRIADYEWSPNGNKLLIFTNAKRVWRYNNRGDYWVWDKTTNELKQLGGSAPESSLKFAKFSPQGDKVAYVSENNIYAENLETGEIVAVTEDGTQTLINGTFDWVYEEEFGLRDGFRWSPDGQSIAYWQLDASNAPAFYLINNTDSVYSSITTLPYPKVGEENSSCRVGVVSVKGGKTTWMKVPGDAQNNYIAWMDWANNSNEIMIQRFNRKQNEDKIMICKAKTGEVSTLMIEKDEAWVDVIDEIKWSKDGEHFFWISERDGWRHVYKANRESGELELLTPGDYDVINLLQINEEQGYLYFIASPDNATQRYLYRSKLKGKAKMERLSPEDQPGTHSYDLSPDASWAFHTYSNANTPPIIELISLPDHKTERELANNKALEEKLSKLKVKPIEFFDVEIEPGVKMDGMMFKPHDFDPKKQYPVIFHVYTEPAGQTARDSWMGSRMMWHHMLTQQGYVVITMDNRGTPAPKGREWRKKIYRQMGRVNPGDQSKAAQQVIKWPYIDSERVGVWGWSGGGAATLNALFRYPEIYKVGVSVAPVTDLFLYDNVYQERYMGLKSENPEDYIEGSPATYAKNLQGDLLLIHGTGDDNVHYQNSEVLINELIKHNKQFSMMAYPNRTHGIWEGKNTTRHLYNLMTEYFLDKLKPGPKSEITQ